MPEGLQGLKKRLDTGLSKIDKKKVKFVIVKNRILRKKATWRLRFEISEGVEQIEIDLKVFLGLTLDISESENQKQTL